MNTPLCLVLEDVQLPGGKVVTGAELLRGHPEYVEATVKCSCGNTFTTRSTKATLSSELCSECHPFYTGKQKLVDTGGRIDRFERRYGKRRKG